MNEYDSDKMADVLGEPRTRDHRQSGGGRRDPVQHLLGAREGAGEGVHDLGRVKHLKQRNPVCSSASAAASPVRKARPSSSARLTSIRVRSADPASPARHDRESAASGLPQVDISFPEIEKFDHMPPARVEGASAFVSIMEGC
jgi:tRNA-2-methylthio-N6-dimethylallyladenosine synthase